MHSAHHAVVLAHLLVTRDGVLRVTSVGLSGVVRVHGLAGHTCRVELVGPIPARRIGLEGGNHLGNCLTQGMLGFLRVKRLTGA